jgi:hypothetical protein
LLISGGKLVQRSIDLSFFTLGTPLIQKLLIDLFLPIPNTRTSLGISIFFANAFYDDNYLPDHFFEKSGGMLNFPYNSMGFSALRHRLHSELTIGLKAFLLPLFHSESLSSNVVGVVVVLPIADMSRKCPIKLLTFNCFSFIMALIVMFVIAAFSGLTGSGLYAMGRNTLHRWCIYSMFFFHFGE